MRRMRHVVFVTSDVAVVLAWTLTAGIWVGVAVRARGRAGSPRGDGRDAVSRAAGAVAILVLVAPQSLWQPVVVSSAGLRLAGIAALVFATGLTIWGRVALGAMWSSGAVVRSGHVLQTTGPYRLTRHPIYTFVLAMVTATALAQGLGRWVPLLLVVAVALVRKAAVEERLLLGEFPAEYASYCRRVPRLLPYPRPRKVDPT